MTRRISQRLAVGVLLALLGGLFSWLSAGVRWNGDVLAFFSAGSADVGNVRSAVGGDQSAAGPGSELRLDVHALPPGSADAKEAVVTGARAIAADLRASGLFRSVWDGVDPQRAAASYAALSTKAPLLTDLDPAALEARMSPAALDRRFSQVKNHLADPDGEILARRLAADPLDLSDIVQQRLQSLAPGAATAPGDAAPNTTLDDGLLMTQDAAGDWHAMIVATPFAPPSDTRGAAAVLAAANSAVQREAASGVGAWIVGPHRGYVENAQRVKTDVTRVSLAGSLAVALLIALFFRRIRAAALCMIPPSIGVGIALGLAGLFHVELPLLLLGFAGLLCGSTTDYGIQLIAECRRLARASDGWRPAIPRQAARRMLGPISMSVATSVTGFAALGLSAAPGLRAMGLFVAAATLCIWIVTFAVIPLFLGPWTLLHKAPAATTTPRTRLPRIAWWTAAAAFIVLTVGVLLPAAARVRFNADPRRLDGSSPQMLADQDAFFRVWGDIRNQAVVLVSADTAAAALDAQQRVADYLADLQRDGRIAGVTSAAPLLPAPSTAAARLAAWKAFWTPERRDALRRNLAAAAAGNGFASAPFAAYAERMADVAPPDPQQELADSPAALLPGFITRSPDQKTVTLAMIVRMNPLAGTTPGGDSLRLATAWAKELRLRFDQLPGMNPPRILSGNVLLFDATDRARAEAERFAPWCLIAILLPLWIYYRSLRRAWLVLLCLIVGFVWVLGVAALLGTGLNLLALVPMLFTLGVAVDYGIYAAAGSAKDLPAPDAALKARATTLCALTTIVGSGSLVLAVHPALQWLGITLVAGITGGFLASLLIVGPLVRWNAQRQVSRPGIRSIRRWGGWALTAALVILTLLALTSPIVEALLARERPAVIEATGEAPLRQLAPRAFAVGDSWMRYRPTSTDPADAAGIWEIRLAGTPAQRGRAVSLLASPLDCRIESEMLDQLDTLLPSEFSRWLLLRAVGVNLATLPRWIPPEDQQELYAAATSYDDPHAYLAPTYPRLLAYHALHDVSQMLIDNPLIVPNTFACTGIVSLPAYSAPADGHLLLGRDFDFEGGESFGRQKSLTYVIPPPGQGIPYAHVAWPGLEGCVTGMNKERIALFINAAATSDFRRIGTPTILMAREILENARSLDDAERIIRHTQVFVSDIVVVADGKTGQARVFEKSPGATAAYDVDASLAVTNHLISPTFAADPVNRRRITDSTTMQRYQRARQLLDQMKQHVTPENLAALLRDKRGLDGKDLGYGNRNAIDGLIACHSVIMDVTAGQMWIAGWPNAEGAYLGFDIMAMLNPDAPATDPSVNVAAVSPQLIPPDRIMTDGTWQRVLAARRAAEAAGADFATGDLPAALAASDEIIAANPAFYLGHALKGRTLLAQGHPAEAKAELQAALAADPPYAARRDALQLLIRQCDTR